MCLVPFVPANGSAGHDDNRNHRTFAASLKHRRFATHHVCEVPLKKTSRKRGPISVRALDRWAMICVLCGDPFQFTSSQRHTPELVPVEVRKEQRQLGGVPPEMLPV